QGAVEDSKQRYERRFSWKKDIFPRLRNFTDRQGNLTSVGNCLINQYLRVMLKYEWDHPADKAHKRDHLLACIPERLLPREDTNPPHAQEEGAVAELGPQDQAGNGGSAAGGTACGAPAGPDWMAGQLAGGAPDGLQQMRAPGPQGAQRAASSSFQLCLPDSAVLQPRPTDASAPRSALTGESGSAASAQVCAAPSPSPSPDTADAPPDVGGDAIALTRAALLLPGGAPSSQPPATSAAEEDPPRKRLPVAGAREEGAREKGFTLDAVEFTGAESAKRRRVRPAEAAATARVALSVTSSQAARAGQASRREATLLEMEQPQLDARDSMEAEEEASCTPRGLGWISRHHGVHASENPGAQSPAGSAQGLEDAGAQSPAGSAQGLEDAGAQSPAGSAQGLEDAGAQSPAGSAQSLEDAGAQSPAGSAQGLEDAAPQLPAGSAQGLEDAGAQSPAGSPSVCRKHGDRPSCTVRGPSEVPQWLVEAYAAHRHIVQLSAELSQAKREKEQLAAQHQQERERAVKAEASQTKMAAEIAQHQQERERLLAAQHQQERERLLAAEGWSKMAGRNKELRAELSQAESEKDRLTTEMAGQVEQLTLELSSTKMNALQRLAETQAEQAQQHQVQLKEAHAVNTQMAASKDALLARARKAEAELVTLREGRTREQLAADGAAHGGDAEHGSTSKEGDILAVADEVDRIVYDPRNCPQATGSEPASRAREAIAQHLAPESCAAAMLQQLRQQSAPTPGSVEICHWPDHMVGGSVSPDVVRENCEELVKANERGTVPPSGCSLVRSGRSLAGTVVREKTVPENDTRLALRGEKMLVAAQQLFAGDVLGCYGGTLTFDSELHETNVSRSLSAQAQHETYLLPIDHFNWDPELAERCKEWRVPIIDPWNSPAQNEFMYINDWREDVMHSLSRGSGGDGSQHVSLSDPARLSRQNVHFLEVNVRGWPHVFVVVIRDIGPDMEVLTDYGEQYWQSKRSQGFRAESLYSLIPRITEYVRKQVKRGQVSEGNSPNGRSFTAPKIDGHNLTTVSNPTSDEDDVAIIDLT
ncbi:hypothetical protein CYMTET_31783, partial [Cymbomonas tetramitiformis]